MYAYDTYIYIYIYHIHMIHIYIHNMYLYVYIYRYLYAYLKEHVIMIYQRRLGDCPLICWTTQGYTPFFLGSLGYPAPYNTAEIRGHHNANQHRWCWWVVLGKCSSSYKCM